jgi:type II secretory ATPase GspE/PulE/Tfp pilus assembly ATPase PilB-like protein
VNVRALTPRLRIGEILERSGGVSGAQLAEGLEEQRVSGERLGRCLLKLGYLPEDALLKALSEQLGIPLLSLARLKVPPEAIRALPLEYVRRHRVMPLELRNGTIRIATSEPGDPRVIDDVRLLSGLEVEEVLAGETEIRKKIAECYQVTVERMIEDLHPGGPAGSASEDLHDIEVMANEPTVINLMNLIIATALRERASDIHLVPFEKALELRYRIDGMLETRPPPPKHLHAALISRVKIMADMNIAERFIPQDGHFQIQHRGARVDVRVGTMPTIYGESVVLRLLEKGAQVLSPRELGLDDERSGLLTRLVEKPYGIFLSTGPTGCGKTTTLYSILSSIYTPERKFLTIEDPVEYELPGVGQIPVRPSRGFTFATGLRSILRQDPDVIMVGEIRDSETAEIAIRAALTGHLVFSTLHTNDAAGAVTRLLDMGVEAFLISSSLEGVLAQRLVRRICADCREECLLAPGTRYKFETMGIDPGEGPYYRGKGCEECRESGYRGRTGLFELLVMRPDLREMIVSKKSSTEIKAAALREMVTIRQDGLRKAAQGITTLEEILRAALGES